MNIDPLLWLRLKTYLVALVTKTNKLAVQVDLVHGDAAAGRGVLADASPGDGAALQAGGLAVVVEAPLLAAAGPRGVATAGVQHTAGLAEARGRGAGHGHTAGWRAGRETQPR